MRRLGLLAASLRAGGVRVGVGELLAAHRALAAVDPFSRRDAYNALRTVLCSRKDDLEVFDAAFVEAFGEPYEEPLRSEMPEGMEEIARAVRGQQLAHADAHATRAQRSGQQAEAPHDPGAEWLA